MQHAVSAPVVFYATKAVFFCAFVYQNGFVLVVSCTQVVTSRDLAGKLGVSGTWEAQREMGALLDYGLAMGCFRFLGGYWLT